MFVTSPRRYGLGTVYYRQEAYGEALVQFRAAADINPHSSVLRCYAGMALAKRGNHSAALEQLGQV